MDISDKTSGLLSSMNSSGRNTRRPLKIILVGSSGVGKTSIINAFFEQPYDVDTQPTVAPAFCSATVDLADKSQVELHIWDTAGQERFQSIGGMFYRDSDIAFVCFERSTKDTIPDWIEKVRKQVPDCIIFLVATKCDLMNEDEQGELLGEKNALIQGNDAKQFFLTSAQKGIGIQELFTAAAMCVDQICAPAAPATVKVEQGRKKDHEKKGCC